MCCRSKAKDGRMPSVLLNEKPAGTTARRVAPPDGEEGNKNTEPATTTSRRVAQSNRGERKVNSEELRYRKKLKPFQLTVINVSRQPPEMIKEFLKPRKTQLK